MTSSAFEGRCRRYSQVAAVAFLLVTAYTVVAKLPQGRLAGDWLHTVLHQLSAAAAVYVVWLSRSRTPARVFAPAYPLLGLVGLFTHGLFLGTVAALPLGAADDVFHLLLGVPALTLALGNARPRQRPLPRVTTQAPTDATQIRAAVATGQRTRLAVRLGRCPHAAESRSWDQSGDGKPGR